MPELLHFFGSRSLSQNQQTPWIARALVDVCHDRLYMKYLPCYVLNDKRPMRIVLLIGKPPDLQTRYWKTTHHEPCMNVCGYIHVIYSYPPVNGWMNVSLTDHLSLMGFAQRHGVMSHSHVINHYWPWPTSALLMRVVLKPGKGICFSLWCYHLLTGPCVYPHETFALDTVRHSTRYTPAASCLPPIQRMVLDRLASW